MRALPVAVLVLLGACSWSNSLYQARRLSAAAAKAEREERGFDAGSLWGQVAVKADTAYARNPEGDRGAEALWLRGRALAHLGDCGGAQPVLERAMVVAGTAEWSADLRVELARCRSLAGDHQGALDLLEPILAVEEGPLGRDARQLAGRALVRAGRWDEALTMLADDDTRDGRWERTIALAELGRAEAALALAEPRILAADSSADWDRLVRITATRSPEAVDDLIDRLGAMRNVDDADRGRWLLAAAEASIGRDEATANRRLEALLTLTDAPATSQARMLLVDRRFTAIVDSASLVATLDRLGDVVRGDPAATFHAERLARWARAIGSDLTAHQPGDAEGDLAMFFQATVARDTLHAPQLAAWLFRRLERDWPASPYLPKALLARLPLEPDSAEAIRGRLARHGDSPYLAFVEGRESARFAALEDSLGFYMDGRLAEIATGAGQDVN